MQGLSKRYFKSHFLPFLPAQAAGRWPEVVRKHFQPPPLMAGFSGWERGAIIGSFPELSLVCSGFIWQSPYR